MEVERVAVVVRDTDHDLLWIAERRDPGQDVARGARDGERDEDVAGLLVDDDRPGERVHTLVRRNLGFLLAGCCARRADERRNRVPGRAPIVGAVDHLRLEHKVVVAEKDLAVATMREPLPVLLDPYALLGEGLEPIGRT